MSKVALRKIRIGDGGLERLRREYLVIEEMFNSIQGEGKYLGVFCTFVRFKGCNLSCTWCDTKKAWLNKEVYEEKEVDKDEMYTVNDLVMSSVAFSDTNVIVITGGEPLFQNLDMMKEYLDILRDLGYFVMMESNGTLIPEDFEFLVNDVNHMIFSPKLMYDNVEEVITRINDISKDLRSVELKFVITEISDINKVFDLLKSHGDYLLANDDICITFMFNDTVKEDRYEDMMKRIKYVFKEDNLLRKVRITPRIQKIWNIQ